MPPGSWGFRVRHHDVEDVWRLGCQHAGNCRDHFGYSSRDVLAGNFQGFAHLDIIRVDVGGRVQLAKERVGAIGLIFQIFPLHHHAEVLIVQDNALDRDLQPPQLPIPGYSSARNVTIDIHDFFIRKRHLAAECSRQTITEPSPRLLTKPAARTG